MASSVPGEDRGALDSSFEEEKQETPIWDASTIADETGLRRRHNGDPSQAGEEIFEGIEVPPWREQITARALVVGGFLGAIFCLITHKLAFSVGIIPSWNVAAGLMGFFMLTLWNRSLRYLGVQKIRPFTRQENSVIQTCVIACSGLAFTGGFSNTLLAMDQQSYTNLVPQEGNRIEDINDPQLGRLIAFMLLISVVAIFAIVPLRKVMVIDYKLTYPSGTATAVLINSFHTPQGAEQARKQIRALGKYFSISFLWSFFKWFFSGKEGCGFDNFPLLGLKARDNRFYFDFNLPFIGVGMICPHIVNFSVLLGAVISWGVLWPLIQNKAGDWYPKGVDSYNFAGINGYRIFIAIALILGDGVYNFAKITVITTKSLRKHYKQRQSELPVNGVGIPKEEALSFDEKRRNEIFLKDQIPRWVAISGYVLLAALSSALVPQLYKPAKWYFVLVAYVIAPVMGFCNAYGSGLTDWSLITTYGKLALFIFASWAGNKNGGVIAGLATATVMQTIVGASADLMQDFKTGYLTLASPRSMFVSQLIGVIMGSVISPLTFWLYWNAFEIGNPKSQYPAPNGTIFRAMAIVGTEGFSALPKHCLQLCLGFFLFAIWVNATRDLVRPRYAKYIPLPMAMAIPFYLGAYFAIDMALGSVILYIWQRRDKKKAGIYSVAIASGLICGDGIWTVPASILALAKVNPPLCMNVLATSAVPG